MLLKKIPITDNGKQYLIEVHKSEQYNDTWYVEIYTIVDRSFLSIFKWKGQNEEWCEIFSLKTEHSLMRDFFISIEKVDFVEMVKTAFSNYKKHLEIIEMRNIKDQLKKNMINNSMLEFEKWDGKF